MWFEVICKLTNAMKGDLKEGKSRPFYQAMKTTLDTDVKFSEGYAFLFYTYNLNLAIHFLTVIAYLQNFIL